MVILKWMKHILKNVLVIIPSYVVYLLFFSLNKFAIKYTQLNAFQILFLLWKKRFGKKSGIKNGEKWPDFSLFLHQADLFPK